MKLAITIPVYINTIAHQNYLAEATKSITTSHEWIFIPVVNRRPSFEMKPYQFTQQPSKVVEIEGRQPQSVAKAWNDGIIKSFEEGCDYALVLNQDLILEHTAIDTLITYVQTHTDNNTMWTMTEHTLPEKVNEQNGGHFFPHPNLASFLVDKTFLEIIGMFDENIGPAYFEDCDIFARIIKSNRQVAVCSDAKFFHYGSKTINSDPDLLHGHPYRFQRNKAYFLGKWGHEPVWTQEEVMNLYYKTPFNRPELDINAW